MSDCSDTRRAQAEAALARAQEAGDQAAINNAAAELALAQKQEDTEVTAVLAAVTATI